MTFSLDTLNMLPTNALASISDFQSSKAFDIANELSSEIARKARLDGEFEIVKSVGGKIVTKATNLLKIAEKYSGYIAIGASVANIALDLINGGEEAYDPESLPPGTVANQESISQMKAEIDSEMPKETKADSYGKELAKAKANANITQLSVELEQTIQTLDQVNGIITKRANGELPNPKLNYENLGAAIEKIINELEDSGDFTDEQINSFREASEARASESLENFEKFVIDNIIVPYSDNKAALDIIRAQLVEREVVDEDQAIFDTVYGPPISTEGKFILSRDGIYYDSRKGSIPHITAQKIDALTWELRYAANRGGKGQLYENADRLQFADTIFSDKYTNETGSVKDFYKYDDILQNLENDRNLQIQDVSGKISTLIASGYAPSSAIVKNYEENYAAIGFAYGEKIRKRKKQLQLAALFGPFGVTLSGDARGEGLFYKINSPNTTTLFESLCGDTEKVMEVIFDKTGTETELEFIPRIPINDFSYLKDAGIVPELKSQKGVILHSSDLDDTTAPIIPVFIEGTTSKRTQSIPELSLSPYGTADWVNTSGDTDLSNVLSSTISGIVPYLRTLDDEIVTDDLVVCYNFLESDAAVTPSSTDFKVKNYVDNGYGLNAKMVGDASSIFVSGVSIPYFTGSIYEPAKKYGIKYSYLPKGSYVRLPNNYRNNRAYPGSQKLDDLMYNQKGWSIEFWAYVPDLSAGLTTDHRYRLVLANENCGDAVTKTFNTGVFTAATVDGKNSFSPKTRTKGMIIGWRDRGNPGTAGASGLEFIVCPTVSQNDSVWGQSVAIAEDVTGIGYDSDCRRELGLKVDTAVTTTGGYTIQEAENGFTHYHISCDTRVDAISLYINGQFAASGAVSELFDIDAGAPLNIPNRIAEGHYHEQKQAYGEKLYDSEDLPETPIFTPWIIGGGFTDGISESPFDTTIPGFLGTNTNTSYYQAGFDSSGGPYGQHTNGSVPGLGGYTKTGTNYKIARSGLDGHVGSVKMYSKPLSTSEVEKNYNAQKPFFEGIQVPKILI